MSESQFHTTLHDNGVAEVVLDRPPVNALNAAGWNALAAEIEALGLRTEVRVIVIRADGKGFCAGVDIKELNADQSLIVSVNAGNYATFKAVHLNKVPVIAAMQGFVLGGGIGICGAADIVIAADDASFGLPEVDRGAMGGAAHLQRMFGVQKTRFLFFTGENPEAFAGVAFGASAFCLAAVGLSWIWIVYRAIRGIITVNDNQPMYR